MHMSLLVYTVDVPLCFVESVEKDSEGIPGWMDCLERLCVHMRVS